MPRPPKLGIVAGSGSLPGRLVAACHSAGRELFVAALVGECDLDGVAGADHVWIEIAAVGRLVHALQAAGCQEVVLAGPVRRPDFLKLRPDWQGVKLLPRVLQAARQGDDALLSTLVRYLEEQGFRVVGADDVFVDLLAPAGTLGTVAPSAADQADIERAIAVVRALGAVDVGQAAVVRDGVVLGVEAVEGTDALLVRCAALQREGRGGVLFKAPKPRQERRVDLPTIGPETVRGAEAARLHGIAVEAQGALVMDREAMTKAADAAGLFVFGVPRAKA